MKTRKIVGIISSILIIMNYIGNVIIDSLLNDKIQVIEFYETIGRLIFALGMIGFYYALIKYLKPYNYKIEIGILITLILIEFVSLKLKGLQYYYGIVPGSILSIVNISAMILFVIFGFRILQSKNKEFENLKLLKLFALSMLIVFGLVIISIATLTFNQRIDLINIVFSIFGIPYFFGLLFFLKDRYDIKQPAVNSGE